MKVIDCTFEDEEESLILTEDLKKTIEVIVRKVVREEIKYAEAKKKLTSTGNSNVGPAWIGDGSGNIVYPMTAASIQ